MKKLIFFIFFSTCFLFFNCKSKKNDKVVDKEHLTPSDYKELISSIESDYNKDAKLPAFKNKDTKLIIQKLTDKNNLSHIINNNQLNIENKLDSCKVFLQLSSELMSLYGEINEKNKFSYEIEMVKLFDLILSIQIESLTLFIEKSNNNQEKNMSTQETDLLIEKAKQTTIKNFTQLIDLIGRENLYSTEGLNLLSKTIEGNTNELIEKHPNTDYSILLNTITHLINDKIFNELDPILLKIKASIETKTNPNFNLKNKHPNTYIEKEDSVYSENSLIATSEAADLNAEGVELGKRNLFEKSIEKFEKALKIEPKNASILSNIGLAHMEMKNFEKSIAYFQKALSYDSKLSLAKINLSLLYLETKEYDKGVMIASEVINDENNKTLLASAYTNRALNLIRLRKCTQAKSDLNHIKQNFTEKRGIQYHINDIEHKLENCSE